MYTDRCSNLHSLQNTKILDMYGNNAALNVQR